MRAGLWTGFFLLENRQATLESMMSDIERLKNAGFECGEMDERNAFSLFVACKGKDANYNAKVIKNTNFFTQLHAPKPVENTEEQIQCENRIISACKEMEIKTIVTHPFIAHSEEDEPKEKSKEYLSRFSSAAHVHGIRLALENQIYPVNMDYYLDSVPFLGVNIDFAHALATQSNVEKMIGKYSSVLYGLHISDSDGRSDDYHIMPGKGILNWQKIMYALAYSKYDGDAHMEIVHERKADRSENNTTATYAFNIMKNIIERM